MEWLAENWFWVLISGIFMGLHLFGHCGHESHDEFHDEAKQKKTNSKFR